jgi:hypothetical protein
MYLGGKLFSYGDSEKGGFVKFPKVTVDYLIFKLLQDKYFIFQWKSNMSNIWGQNIYFIWNRFIDFQLPPPFSAESYGRPLTSNF